MLCSVFTKKSRTEDQIISQESNISMQASLLASAALTAEVAVLKQDLEGSRKELGLAKRQLKENKGTQYPVCIFIKKKLLTLIIAS